MLEKISQIAEQLANMLFPCCLVAVSALALVQPATAVPVYNIVPLGLDDLEHTHSDGYNDSYADRLNEAGQVLGYSPRYNGGTAHLGWSVWLYDGATTIAIGLTGAEYTNSDGYKLSAAYQLNQAGQVSGFSSRYNGGGGQSVWLYDGATTIDIGLTGSEHTNSDGFKWSEAYYEMNEAGQLSGTSFRYNGGTSLGQSVWLYDGATTIDIGLTGSEHTNSEGFKWSFSYLQLNEAGQMSGHSLRYNGGNTDLGQSVWLYDGATTIDVGLTGSEHTRNDGYKFSFVSSPNEAGQVTGISQRYNGGSDYLGYSVWLYGGATTIAIGLTGSEHTRNDGYKFSGVSNLNDAGQVSGLSARFNGSSSDLGQTTWLYDGAITIDIGLTGSEHTRNDGYKASTGRHMNEAGQVSGGSARYIGAYDLGQSAWLYDAATTIGIGLTGSEHTRNDGYKYSEAYELNEAGQVQGFSYRYHGGGVLSDLGRSAWLYDGAITIDIGLAGSEHTRNDGYKFSFADELNEAGQVRGVSQRFNGGSTELGQDAWFYDPLLDQTFSLNLSTRSDGYAYSQANYLGQDGLILGSYTLFNAFDNNLGQRAFYFTIADGLHDLGALVDGGLPANGWDSLADAISGNSLGQILGYGKLTSQSVGRMPYLLTPVPEPATVVMFALNMIAACVLRGRRACVGSTLRQLRPSWNSGGTSLSLRRRAWFSPVRADHDQR